jgi:hypothetical protein
MMQITEKHHEEIKKIMADMTCPKDFICYTSGFENENMCRVKDIGLDGFVDCSQEAPFIQMCSFSLSFGKNYLCTCPLRIYLVKHLHC